MKTDMQLSISLNTKDTKIDFALMQTDNVHISKQTMKEKRNLPWQLKAGKIKMKTDAQLSISLNTKLRRIRRQISYTCKHTTYRISTQATEGKKKTTFKAEKI